MDKNQFNLTAETFPSERYEVIKEIGRGASGVVYLCKDTVLIKDAAVKTLRSLTVDQLVSFQQEARSTSRMSHPNIVKVLDFGVTTGGVPYMVMDVFDGINLEQHLKRSGRLAVSAAIEIFTKVADALAYAHEMQIFHRDLKPSNIILNLTEKEPQVKLIDFGVGKVKQEHQEPAVYQGITIAGTPGYMSCDQVNGIPYDERSEVYALGCVLFEALTGRTPFTGENALDIFYQHANVEAPSLFEVTGERFSQSIQRLIARCLAKEPDERFQSMYELAQALRTITQEGRFLPGQTTIMWTPEKKQMKPALLYSLLLLLTTIAGSVFWSVLTARNNDEQKPMRRTSHVETSLGLSDMMENQEEAFAGGIEERNGEIKAVGVWKLEDFQKVSQMKKVRSASFEEVVIDPKGLEYLTGLPLVTLNLNKCDLNDDDLAPIKKIRTLQTLFIAKNNLTDGCLRYLTELPHLTTIDISGNKLTMKGITQLFAVTTMQAVDIRSSKLKPTLWKEIAKTGTHVVRVTVDDTTLLKGDLSYIRQLPLNCIIAENCQLRDADLKEIGKMKLIMLDLSANPELTDEALTCLYEQRTLTRLILNGCPKITLEAVNQLRKRNPALLVTN